MALVFEALAGNTLVARGPTNLGLYVFGQGDAARAVVIDSGGDEDAGRRIVRECERLGVRLAAVLNTHSNADHCGGNAFVKRRTGCAIAATEIEAAFLQYPHLEPSFLAGGYPQKAIRNKFLMAPPSHATHLLEPPCRLVLDEKGDIDIRPGVASAGSRGPERTLSAASPGNTASSVGTQGAEPASGGALHIVALPGHYFGMVGVMTPDRVFFAADALAGASILEKYHIFFFYDVAAELETLAMLEAIEAEWFVPSHAEPVRDIRPLVGLNRAKIFEIAEVIVGLVQNSKNGASLEDVVAEVCAHYGIVLNADQHVLVGSTIRSYLSWLCDQGRLEYGFEHNRMTFEVKQ
jgi:glyoxylase-like metal-dependent hydrolase (beta-lactamase superfamily II)